MANPSGDVPSRAAVKVVATALGFIALGGGLYFLNKDSKLNHSAVDTVRVLSYGAFVNSWGPGPELAREFEKRFGKSLQFQDAGDAGMILQKLELFPADLVLGLDQFSIELARSKRKWQKLASGSEFEAFDEGPLTFIYRKSETAPPGSLKDLLKPEFRDAIALEDPSTSTPGMQFYFWVLDSFGIEEGLSFLNDLKPNVHSVAPSWSTAYGMFTKKQSKLVFSYFTSAVYHWSQENDFDYQPAVFSEGDPVQQEYFAIPQSCNNCAGAKQFANFLLEPSIQKIIMEKNYMLPAVKSVKENTLFASLPAASEYKWKNLPALLKDREALLGRWRQLNL